MRAKLKRKPKRNPSQATRQAPCDYWLFFTTIALIAFGLMMVSSASIDLSDHIYGNGFHFLLRQTVFLLLGIIAAYAIVQIDTRHWQRLSPYFLLIGFAMLVLVLIPGIGHEVNGSRRWLGMAGVGLQISEVIKLIVILYIAGYLVRHAEQVQYDVGGFVKPIIILGLISALLLKEPDFGASVVIVLTCFGMMFLAGVRLWQFIVLFCLVALLLAIIAIASPYRLARITSFLNPWQHAFSGGYQLTQSLIGFGRGGWLGLGLGRGIQKLFYLPEAHTDFIFSVIGEELGLIGMLSLLLLFAIFVVRALKIGRMAALRSCLFSAYVAFGIAFWVSLQVMINVGVSTGLLPTKGLTLPFISYGGSSLLVMCMAVGLLLRIDYENRRQHCRR